jgi:protease PrsW
MVSDPGVGVCCVCDRPIEGEARAFGRRVFCVPHHERAAREGPAAAMPILIEIGAVVLFAAAVSILASLTRVSFGETGQVLVGLVLAVVPAVIWLVAFYRLDRLEPEPKHYVLGVAVLGGILAAAIGQPLIRGFFQVQDWLYDSAFVGILGSIFIVGFVEEFLKYAGIRYTVFHSPEFDEPADGIVYGAAIGLGYATVLNVGYIVDHNGVDLGVGAIQVAVVALAHASFSGVVGYFLGRAKFERMGPIWLPLGLTVAAVLNGIVTHVLRVVPTLGGFGYHPWYGLVIAAVVAAATFFVLFRLVRRLNAAVLAAPGTSRAS